MKKSALKSAKSIMIAAAVCASLAFGALSAVSASDSTVHTIVATHPNFSIGLY